MTIRILSPEGRVTTEASDLSATPELLAGRRIAVLDNGKPGAALLMETLVQGLAARSGATMVGTFQKGSAATPCEAPLLDQIVAEADLVVTGSAD